MTPETIKTALEAYKWHNQRGSCLSPSPENVMHARYAAAIRELVEEVQKTPTVMDSEKVADLTRQLEEAVRQRDQSHVMVGEAHNELQKHRQKADDLVKQQLAFAIKERDALHAQLAELQDRNEMVEEDCECARKERDGAREELKETMARLCLSTGEASQLRAQLAATENLYRIVQDERQSLFDLKVHTDHENTQLRSQVSEANETIDGLNQGYASAGAALEENARLRAEVSALKADKERLDWLEGSRATVTGTYFNGEHCAYCVKQDGKASERGQTLRAAIDAARGKEQA